MCYFVPVDSVVAKMKALGDSNRFRMAMMLRERPLCVCEMLSVLDIAGTTASSHLKILKNAGIIRQRKDGRWVEYFIADDETRKLLDYIAGLSKHNSKIEEDRRSIRGATREDCACSAGRV